MLEENIMSKSPTNICTEQKIWCGVRSQKWCGAWLQKMLMCSEPDLEISQCAAEIWGLGAHPQARSGAVRGAKPPETLTYFMVPYAILAITNLTKMISTSMQSCNFKACQIGNSSIKCTIYFIKWIYFTF